MGTDEAIPLDAFSAEEVSVKAGESDGFANGRFVGVARFRAQRGDADSE